MGFFIFSLVLAVVGIGVMVGSRHIDDDEYQSIAKTAGAIALCAGAVMFLVNCFTIVPPRNVGVQVVVGKATTSLDNGFHLVPPWSDIENVDATVKNINRSGAPDAPTSVDGGNITGSCITVRLANQTTACVDVTVQWNIDREANANELWQRYRGTNDDVVGNVAKNVVDRQLRVSLNDVFESYNPLKVLTTGDTTALGTTALAERSLAKLRASVDSGVVIDVVSFGIVHYDPITQEKLNGYAQALADTQIATQQKLTAEQQKAANATLAVASSNDPGVKYQNCLNMITSLAAKGQLQNLQYGGLMCSQGNNSLIVGK